MYRILGALLGFVFFRFPGAVLGFLLGLYFDQSSRPKPFNTSTRHQQVSPADFELHLLSLASLVIKADGTVDPKELDYVRRYFVSFFGKERANESFRIFNEVVKKRSIQLENIAGSMRSKTTYETRLQILHFLFKIAEVDGAIIPSELSVLEQIAYHLGINTPDFQSIKAMFFRDLESPYKILEIERTASNDEVKAAYRTMAKKYHPDKVAHLGESHKKLAEQKFKEVQKAYEKIKSQRSF
ncbi:MAG: TerB family tellurite resistance protein [Flavobacteriaceae bacterium]|nr:TerB family tellurite resistance protein [Flavobacteriaceae bacterium]